MIQSVFKAEGLPLDLAYIPIIESGFKTNALSKANAKGPWQFMKATARRAGTQARLVRRRAVGSREGDARGGEVPEDAAQDVQRRLAPRPRGVQRRARPTAARHEESRTEDFWQLSESSRFLPKETREYVPLILAAIVVAKNPVQYGFNVLPAAPVEYEKVLVPRAIDLRRVAEWTGQTIDDVQALNPELRRWTTPLATPNYEIKVPAGTASMFADRLAAASPDQLASLKWLHGASRRIDRHDRPQAQRQPNGSGGSQQAVDSFPGSGRSGAPDPSRSDRSDGGERLRPSAGGGARHGPSARRRLCQPSRREPSATLMYRVKRGDTLSSIARLFNTTVAKLRSWNRLPATTSRRAIA